MDNKKKNLTEIYQIKSKAHKLLKNKDTTYGLARALRLLLKEVKLYKNHFDGKSKIENREMLSLSRKIQVGGGNHILDGFLNIDINPPADIIFDVREGLPLKSNYADLIFSEHFLEHIDYPVSAKKFIKECYRVLNKNGKLIIGVPNSELVIKNYIERSRDFWKLMLNGWYSKRKCLKHFNTYIDLVNYHFRDQDDNLEYNPHYWAYDFEKLKSLIKSTGFTKMDKWKFDSSIANPEREWGSLYVVATK